MESKHESTTAHENPAEWLEALNRAILESALDCIITMDAHGRVLEFNPAAERVFGFSRAEAVGQELAELIIPPALRESHRRGLAHYLKTGEGPVLDLRIEIAAVRADGTEILVELAITAFRIAGAPVFTAYLRDITERLRDERRRAAQYSVVSLLAGSWSLAEAGERILQTIAESGDWIFGSIWLYDETEDAVACACTWQAAGKELKNFERITRQIQFKRSVGLPGRVLDLKKPIWIRDVTEDQNFPRAKVAAEVGLRGGFAFPLRAESEVNGIIELFCPSIVEPDNDLLQLVDSLGSQIGLFMHRRKMEKELQQQKENAEAANAAKDQFLAALSHELRTPLNPVLIWADGMMHQPGLPPEIAEGLEMVSRNVELEARLIEDLLDLTRITRGKLQLVLRLADAHELIRHAMDIVRSDISDRQIDVTIRLDAANHHVVVDPARLQQAFWNLLRNAYKFTPDHGVVSVRSSNPTPDTLTIEISDTGIGIEADSLGKIFDAFKQAGPRREGLGLGLAISKAVVEMHGGKIRAESAGLGKGATFLIDLPTAPTGEEQR
jgi:two-component system, cell cycle sensor histidine kinase and response regulator CckA